MRALSSLFRASHATPLRAARWVVIDCETSGLDPDKDRLISVGAVAVQNGTIQLGSAFAMNVGQAVPSDAANILIHGIGAQAQAAGPPAAEVLRAFAAFVGDGLPVAFSAPFDAAVLRRAMASTQSGELGHWLDVAALAPALFPEAGPAKGASRSLDDWLAHFHIECTSRHDALGDAYATAQLFLVLLAEAERQGSATVTDLRRVARSARWLSAR